MTNSMIRLNLRRRYTCGIAFIFMTFEGTHSGDKNRKMLMEKPTNNISKFPKHRIKIVKAFDRDLNGSTIIDKRRAPTHVHCTRDGLNGEYASASHR